MAIDPKDLSIHDELVVETEVGGVSVFLASFITNILADELWLATRLPEPRLAELEAGQSIHLTFDRGGALIVESTFLRRLGGGGKLGMEKSRVFAVRRPQGIQNVQRRAHVRVDLERNVRIRALGTLGHEELGSGRTTNIGAGGVQFVTDMPLLFGQQLRLALVLTSRDIVVVGGTIVRIEDGEAPTTAGTGETVRPDPSAPRRRSRVAVRFDKISEPDQERITCHILAAHRQRAGAQALAGLAARPVAPPDAPTAAGNSAPQVASAGEPAPGPPGAPPEASDAAEPPAR